MTPLNKRQLILGLSAVSVSGLSSCTDNTQNEVSSLLKTKAEVEKWKNGAVKLDYILDDDEYQFVLYPSGNNTFQIRINRYNYIKEIDREDWQNLKKRDEIIPGFGSPTLSYSNERDFGIKLGQILNHYVGTERGKIPNESDEIYKLLGGNSRVDSTGEIGTSGNKLKGYRENPIDLGYKEKHREKTISGITAGFGDRNTIQGRILRCLRWKNITETVEDRYGIPHGLLLAMMAQEGYGDPTLPNLGGDGGLGLIHIQATNAKDYGLKTLKRYNNGMRDIRHGREINKVLKKEDYDLRELIAYDDRFHPIMAVDVAARFLMDKKRQALRAGLSTREKKNVWVHALKRYSGRGLRDYAYPVLKFWHAVCAVTDYEMPHFNGLAYPTSPKSITRLQKSMDDIELKIGGKSASYKDYLKYNYAHNYNYDLKKYKNIGKYPNK